MRLGPKREFGAQFYPILAVALLVFEEHYNSTADDFAAFVDLCRRDKPRKPGDDKPEHPPE